MLRSRCDLKTGWAFRKRDENANGNGDASAWLPVKEIPSEVHVDLLANNIIPDPFIDKNELAVQWVAEKDWVYRTSFAVPVPVPVTASATATDLVFEGLDTFATVYLNGVEILKSENMHIAHRVNITDKVRHDALNDLEIVFESALLRGRELVRSHPEHKHFARQTEESRIPVRKGQYHWGWDWGPILTTAGPWRPVYLEQYVVRLEDIWAQYEVSSDLKTCSGSLRARVHGHVQTGEKILLSLSRNGKVFFEKTCEVDADGLSQTSFQLKDPSLWYPAGYGPQSRYRLSAEITRGLSKLDSTSKLIGFRSCELVQEEDPHGRSFYFRVNGIDIFSGGSCWIPADSFLSQISSKRYFEWIKLLVEGNQIMIRVWGGGIYEDDSFLDACDAFGVLVWQDFAFACGNYPAYPEFLASVEDEVRQNLRRFRSHPSVIAWAGNNEDYQVLERYKLEYQYEDKDPESWLKTTFPARYIYEHLLPELVKEEHPSATYHPGSPWGDGKHSADPTVGDVHQWNIWHGQMAPYQNAPQLSGRFVSEFGMEAYPHLQTTRRMITDPAERRPGSATMDFRNKAGDHERRLMTYVAENFSVRYDLPSFTHLTQVMQAETMLFAYKSWRRMWGAPGARQCGGVLVWQLNDCWPTMSWAVVDYYLVKKPAYYAIARAMRPLDVGIARGFSEWTSGHSDPTTAKDCEFDVWVASSRLEDVEVQLGVRFISIKTGRDIRDPLVVKTVARSNATTEVLNKQRISSPDWERHDPFVIHAVLSVGVNGRVEVEATDTAWPQPLKYLDFSDRKVSLEISPSKDEITVWAEKPVKGFVFEEREGVRLSDNGFDLVPGEKKVLRVSGGAAAADEFAWRYVGSADQKEEEFKPKL